MAPGYVDTPQTTAGDKTYLTNGLDRLDQLSPEKSFASPSKNNDLIQQIQMTRKGNGLDLKTPRAGGRAVLRTLPNGALPKGEFTPLMKSVAKKNLMRRASGKGSALLETPAGLANGYKSNGQTPALPRGDMSQLYNDNTSSSVGDEAHATPLPQVATSSSQSTPLAQLPGRDGHGGVVGDGNLMTLREQEHIIDKIEKENFGLKMKIHFLEQAMSQSGREFNQAALKENTDLKVNRITMQKELHKFRKNIAQAERDAELYRLQLEEYRERLKRKQADESMRMEMNRLQSELTAKEARIEELENQFEAAKDGDDEQIGRLRGEIGDLEADLRDRDRVIDEKDDQIDDLKENAGKESNAAAELEDELDTAKRQIEDLQEDLERVNAEAKEAKEEREEAIEEKKEAENNLEELRDEMMNKSFSTKGLSRQLEEKTGRLEQDLEELQDKYANLQEDVQRKVDYEKELQEQLRNVEREGASERRHLQSELDTATRERDNAKRDFDKMSERLQQAMTELLAKKEEKDLLQTRHDALTEESGTLQRDLAKAKSNIKDLERALDEERHHAAQNDNILRSQHKVEVDLLTEQIDTLHREVNAKESQHASNQDEWDALRRTLETASRRAEERASGLQRTVDKLQEVGGTLSGKESNLQDALNSEKQRHRQEEDVLNRQIQQLNEDIAAKREASEAARNELGNAKEELRISIREQAALKEKADQLEEEVEVLQANLEEEAEYAEAQKAKSDEDAADQLRELKQEKQSLQDQLANVNIELHDCKRSLREAKADLERKEARLQRVELSPRNKYEVDQEKRELQREKLRLEKDLDRAKQEKKTLSEANVALEQEINAEIERANLEENRLNGEIDRVRNQQLASGENRERELVSAKNKVQRLERRIKELEDLLDNKTAVIESPSAGDVSMLRRDLNDARRKEMEAVQRESDLKTSIKELKITIVGLENEVYELQRSKFSTRSPSTSPPSSKDLAKTRQELLDAQVSLKETRSKNRELERQFHRAAVDEEERKDLHELVKSSTLEAEALSLKLSDRDERITQLKTQVKRLREERNTASNKAEALGKQFEYLEQRYVAAVDKVQKSKASNVDRTIHDKELKGLAREIQWLRAKWQREVQFRSDLAWGKNFMEMGEIVRSACNQADLQMIREMGINVRESIYTTKLSVRQKFRAGVHVVIAAGRMRHMAQDWKQIRKIGDGLKKVKSAMDRKRLSGK